MTHGTLIDSKDMETMMQDDGDKAVRATEEFLESAILERLRELASIPEGRWPLEVQRTMLTEALASREAAKEI